VNISVVAFNNEKVTEGLSLLLKANTGKEIFVFIPVTEGDLDFAHSAIKACREHSVKITAVVEAKDDLLEEILSSVDFVLVSENPVKEIINQLQPGDTLAVAWDGSPQAHSVIHAVEDLALDTWDITDGLVQIDSEIELSEMDSETLHDIMHESLGTFVDALTAFVASAVMESLGQAIAEHILHPDKTRDINPFDEEE